MVDKDFYLREQLEVEEELLMQADKVRLLQVADKVVKELPLQLQVLQ